MYPDIINISKESFKCLNGEQDVSFEKFSSFISRDKSLAPDIYIVKCGQMPKFVLKIQSPVNLSIVSRMLCKEFASLEYVYDRLSFKKGVPAPVDHGMIGARRFNIERFIPGKPMSELLSHVSFGDVKAHFLSALEWLEELASCAAGIKNTVLFKDRYYAELKRFDMNFPEESIYFRDYFHLDLPDFDIPNCPKHGDFFISNILLSEDLRIIGVTDFEDFSKKGFPFEDLYNFIVTYLFALGRHKKLGIIDRSSFLDLVKGLLQKYNSSLFLGEKVLEALFKYYWLVSINRQIGAYRRCPQIASFRLRKIMNKPRNIEEFIKSELVD